MKPLGLFPNRLKSLIAVSERFLSMTGEGGFDVGLDKERKIYGIGEFGYTATPIPGSPCFCDIWNRPSFTIQTR